MARVLLLMPTSTYHAHDFVEAAARLGLDVTVGTNGSQALQALVPGATLTLDFGDLAGARRAVAALAAEYPIDAVVAAEDETTTLASVIAADLGVPHNPVAAVARTQSKLSMRRALAAAGLASPRFWVMELDRGARSGKGPHAGGQSNGGAEAFTAPSGATFPCVLKPTFLSASRGVIRADDEAQFAAAARRIAAILDDAELRRAGGHEAATILVEEYIPGDEYAVEAMLRDGRVHPLALFDKPDALEGPYFEETIYVTPSRTATAVQEEIHRTVQKAVDAIGLREGPLHAELRVNETGAYVIDIAARAIGGLCPRVLRFGTGSSLEELILRHALGEDFAQFAREDRAAGVMMIPIPGAGTLRAVEGVDGARALAGIREVTISLKPGQELVPLPEGNRYLGFIFSSADTPEAAESALRLAHRELRIEVD